MSYWGESPAGSIANPIRYPSTSARCSQRLDGEAAQVQQQLTPTGFVVKEIGLRIGTWDTRHSGRAAQIGFSDRKIVFHLVQRSTESSISCLFQFAINIKYAKTLGTSLHTFQQQQSSWNIKLIRRPATGPLGRALNWIIKMLEYYKKLPRYYLYTVGFILLNIEIELESN